jgi:hypothetical protein
MKVVCRNGASKVTHYPSSFEKESVTVGRLCQVGELIAEICRDATPPSAADVAVFSMHLIRILLAGGRIEVF